MRKVRKIGVVYDPVNISTSLVAQGGALTQKHYAETAEYIPDREVTPLVLYPRIWVDDPNQIQSGGYKKLSSTAWYALPKDIADHVDKEYLSKELSKYLITVASPGYAVQPDGSLVVSKNIPYLSPEVLVFIGDYCDARTGNIVRAQAMVVLSSTSVSVSPELVLDKPASWTYNPIKDEGLRTITATFRLGGVVPDAAVVKFWWYRVSDGGETLVNPEEDLFYEGGQETNSLKIDPRFIENALLLRCKVEYSCDGDPLPDSPTEDCLKADTLVLRRCPAFDYEHFVHGGLDVSPDAKSVHNECVVTVGSNVIEEPARWFQIKWFIKNYTFGADWRELGTGETIDIDANEFRNGADVALEVEERGPLGAASLDGFVLTDDNAVLIL